MEKETEGSKEKIEPNQIPWCYSIRGATSPFLAIANLTRARRQLQVPNRRHNQTERMVETTCNPVTSKGILSSSVNLKSNSNDGPLVKQTEKVEDHPRVSSDSVKDLEPTSTGGIVHQEYTSLEKRQLGQCGLGDTNIIHAGTGSADIVEKVVKEHAANYGEDGQNVTINVFHISNSKGVVINQEKIAQVDNIESTDQTTRDGHRTTVARTTDQSTRDVHRTTVTRPKSVTCGLSHSADNTQSSLHTDSISAVLKRIIDKTWQLLDLSANELFIPTRAMAAVRTSLVDLGVVVVTGRSGDGKTSLCHRVLKDVAEGQGRNPLVISTPDEWKLIPPSQHVDDMATRKTFVVLIDDIFGRTNLSKDDLRMWERELATMWPLVETGQVLLLIASRGAIFMECRHNIRNYKIFSSAKEIALNTAQYTLKFGEKMCIMEAYLRQRKALMMSHKDMTEAVRTSGELGFPQICKFYISSREAQKHGLAFFGRPLQYLMDEIKTLRDLDLQAYIVLLLLTFNKGFLRQCDLDPFSTKSLQVREQLELLKTVWNVQSGFGLGDVWTVAERMCHVYLTLVQGCYKFSHQSIYETVVLEFASKYPRKGIEIAPIDILLNLFWTEEYKQDRPSISIVVKEEYYDVLASRVLEEMKSENAEKIIDHPALNGEKFLKCLCSLLSDGDKSELSTRTVPSTYTDMECYSVFSNDYIVWKFKSNDWRPWNSVNKDIMPLPLRELHVPSLLFVKGHHSLLSALHPPLFDKHNFKWKSLLASSAFVGDTTLVFKLLDTGVVLDETCVMAALLCSEDNSKIIRRVLYHSDAPELGIEQIIFCLKFAVHCKKPKTIKLLIGKLPDGQIKQDVLETVIKLVFVDLLSKPGLFSPCVKLPKINTDNSSVAMFQVLLSAHAPWDPDKSLLVVSQSEDLLLLKKVVWESSMRERSHIKLLEHDLQTDFPDAGDPSDNSPANCHFGHGTNQPDKYGCTPLHNAAYGGTASCVELLLVHGANVLAMNNIKETPLHEAAKSKRDCAEKLMLLLKAGAEIDAQDAGSRTPLHALAMKGKLEDFKVLVERGANINATDNLNQTPLHLSSCVFTPESSGKIRLLTERKADINAVDKFGCTALIYVAEKGTVGILKYLIEEGADVNIKTRTGKTTLHKAAASCTGSVAKMELLLHHHCGLDDVDEDGWTALLRAADSGSTESLTFLVSRNCSLSVVNIKGQTALHLVSQSPFAIKEKLLCLVKSGANINAVDLYEGSTPLHCAAGDGAVSTVDFLLENKASVDLQDEIGLTPLHRAAQSLIDPGEKIKILIKNGAQTNIKDHDGHTPLFHAAEHGTVDGLRALVADKANLSIRGLGGQTVLHKTVQKYLTSSEKVEYLIKMGADVNAEDDIGNTPLHFAALEASFNTLKCLADSGAKAECVNESGTTPLHNAVKSSIDSKRKIAFLLNCGTNIYAKDRNGDTPIHFAADDTCEKLQFFIFDLEADISLTDKEGNTLLYRAAMSSHDIKSKTMLLLEQGADINAKGKHGWNLTHWAISLGSGEDLDMLLDKGADPFVADEDGSHLIHKAATSRTECALKLKVLLERGVSVNTVDENGCSPLHVAAELGTGKGLEFLVNHGADICMINGNGRTALHLAVTSKYESDVKIKSLVEKGADMNVYDVNHRTPLHDAADTGTFAVFKYLITHGSDVDAVDELGRTTGLLAADSKVEPLQKTKFLQDTG